MTFFLLDRSAWWTSVRILHNAVSVLAGRHVCRGKWSVFSVGSLAEEQCNGIVPKSVEARKYLRTAGCC